MRQPISVASDPGNAERLLVAERESVVDEVVAGAVTPIADINLAGLLLRKRARPALDRPGA